MDPREWMVLPSFNNDRDNFDLRLYFAAPLTGIACPEPTGGAEASGAGADKTGAAPAVEDSGAAAPAAGDTAAGSDMGMETCPAGAAATSFFL